MAQLLHGNCITEMKQLENRSVDLIFCDLPYGQTSCAWDTKIDLEGMWKEFMRIKKFTTPIFFTTTTKFGVELINSAPKDCPFRYDLVWCKSSACGHLLSAKMPMRKHEMLYVFYERLPLYDISSHKHKFLRESKGRKGKVYADKDGVDVAPSFKYTPPLPTSLIKEEKMNSEMYGELPTTDNYAESIGMNKSDKHKVHYDPPLPTSLIKEEEDDGIKKVMRKNTTYGDIMTHEIKNKKNGDTKYEPPLPTSLIKEEAYVPPQIRTKSTRSPNSCYGELKYETNTKYEPPLPNSLLEIKSTRGKHSTEKPVALMEWILKYYSKEGDTVLDPTCGSGSTGVSCKNMNRNFIGIEMDDEIYETACARVWGNE